MPSPSAFLLIASIFGLLWGSADVGRGEPPAAGPRAPAAGRAAAHVLTAEYYAWNGGYAGPLGVMGRYTSWAIGGEPAKVHAAGMKTYAYTDPNRAYGNDHDYRIKDLLEKHPGAIAKTCSGRDVTISAGKGILTDVRTPDAIVHTSALVAHVLRSGTDAVFVDDSDDVLYTDDGPPCGYSPAAWLAGTRAMYAAQAAPLIFNGLNMAEYGVDTLPLADLPNVVGAMWEGCYGFADEWGVRGDGTSGLREHWADTENAELAMARKHKAFWCFNTARGAGADRLALRSYAYASFLLTYDLSSDVYETQMTTPSQLRVFPETGFVAAAPVNPPPNDVSALQLPDGAYGREFRRCSYRGAPIGTCAVVVNPEAVAHRTPFGGRYGHAIALRGAGVLDGGTLAVEGSAAPGTLGPHSGAILVP